MAYHQYPLRLNRESSFTEKSFQISLCPCALRLPHVAVSLKLRDSTGQFFVQLPRTVPVVFLSQEIGAGLLDFDEHGKSQKRFSPLKKIAFLHTYAVDTCTAVAWLRLKRAEKLVVKSIPENPSISFEEVFPPLFTLA